MGSLISRAYYGLFYRQKHKIVMVGLDEVGKTHMLYKMNLGEVVSALPGICLNLETVEFKNFKLYCWDFPFRNDSFRGWKPYFKDARGLILVVDSSDREKIDKAR